jgi:hypothetical protein
MPPLFQQAKLFEKRVGWRKGGQTPKDEPGHPFQLLGVVRQPIEGGILNQPTLQTLPGQPIAKDKDLGKTLAGRGRLGCRHGVREGGRRPRRLNV